MAAIDGGGSRLDWRPDGGLDRVAPANRQRRRARQSGCDGCAALAAAAIRRRRRAWLSGYDGCAASVAVAICQGRRATASMRQRRCIGGRPAMSPHQMVEKMPESSGRLRRRMGRGGGGDVDAPAMADAAGGGGDVYAAVLKPRRPWRGRCDGCSAASMRRRPRYDGGRRVCDAQPRRPRCDGG
uniref:DUF834 domain-containing protein n=1 Tax=Oryza meridionalis TaxID=40149 RepID=A0A0E0E945_9ORYZ